MFSLQWARVDFSRKTIIIQESKNGKPRTIPLDRVAFDILAEKSKIRNIKYDFVFISRIGTKINCHNLRRIFNIAVKKAGLQDFRFHDLRHTLFSSIFKWEIFWVG
ncbi:MAG: site-specific integrase [Candidatus Brocadia sinica]|nr:site-specific integrase [Candidatus Brocadia sinica]NUO05667.1 site-specific integrase [Candidatus Brocadia sinica]